MSNFSMLTLKMENLPIYVLFIIFYPLANPTIFFYLLNAWEPEDVIYWYERGLNELMEKVFAGVFNLQLRKNNL